ncbi:MAG: trypsin-like peptidase domain-containing protein [Ferruginibacter sp.]|nr:trypsin-like peptidase domain-containing protein [Ferruginibacter sp.]
MDDIVLLEAVERYLRGEMSPEEKAFFEGLRKKDPEVDQLVVEHTYFLQGLETFGTTKAFKHNLQEVEDKLIEEGLIGQSQLKGTAKLLFLWKKYQRNIAVAASIAGFISLLAASVMVTYTKKYSNENYRVLVDQLNKTNREVSKLKSKEIGGVLVNEKPEVDFRATGFLIDGKGYLVTNAHVISKRKNIYIENRKGDFYRAEALYTDQDVDLAILKITDTAFKTVTNLPYSIKKGNSDLGEQFFTLGFPRNEIVYGEGYLSAKSGNDGDSTAYQLTVSANPGNSGGPVINRNGEIIGIITAKDSKADGVVYAAKSKNIINLLEKLKKLDDKYQVIKIPSNSDLKGLDRVQQVKKMEEFVFMVVGN